MSLGDDLSRDVSRIFSQSWNIRDGSVVPSTEDIALAGGAVKLDATFLYTDLAQSSYLATDFQQRTAAKVMKAFLYCMARIISANSGNVTSFDGDRVMGVFIGGSKNTNAARCSLQMNYAMGNILKPRAQAHFTSLRETGFPISHCVGIDTSEILVVRAGQRGSNDLVWIGRAPNLAVKLSEIRENYYHSFISDDVFTRMSDSVKYGGDPKKEMWERRSISFAGENTIVYRSSWWWEV